MLTYVCLVAVLYGLTGIGGEWLRQTDFSVSLTVVACRAENVLRDLWHGYTVKISLVVPWELPGSHRQTDRHTCGIFHESQVTYTHNFLANHKLVT